MTCSEALGAATSKRVSMAHLSPLCPTQSYHPQQHILQFFFVKLHIVLEMKFIGKLLVGRRLEVTIYIPTINLGGFI